MNNKNECQYCDICPVMKANGDQVVPMVHDGFLGEFKNFKISKNDINDNKPTIIMVGEAPATEEEVLLTPFVGSAGKILRKTLYNTEFLNSFNVILTNAVKCRPIDIKNKKNFRTPAKEEIEFCVDKNLSRLYSNLLLTPEIIWTHKSSRQVLINNVFIVLLGHTALTAQSIYAGPENIIKAVSKESINLNNTLGTIIKYKYISNLSINSTNIQVYTYVAYHPSYYIRNIANIQDYESCFSNIKRSILEIVSSTFT